MTNIYLTKYYNSLPPYFIFQPPNSGRQPAGLPRAPAVGGLEPLRGQLQPLLDGVPLGRPRRRTLRLIRKDGQREVVLPERQRLQGENCVFSSFVKFLLLPAVRRATYGC